MQILQVQLYGDPETFKLMGKELIPTLPYGNWYHFIIRLDHV
jgi:hypothetical protein